MMNEHVESQQLSKRLAWLGQVFSMPDHRLPKKLVSGEVIHLSSQVVTLMLLTLFSTLTLSRPCTDAQQVAL